MRAKMFIAVVLSASCAEIVIFLHEKHLKFFFSVSNVSQIPFFFVILM